MSWYENATRFANKKTKHPCKEEGCKRNAFVDFSYCVHHYSSRSGKNRFKFKTEVPKKDTKN